MKNQLLTYPQSYFVLTADLCYNKIIELIFFINLIGQKQMFPIRRIMIFIKRNQTHLIVLSLALILMVLLGKLLGFWSIFFDALIAINFLIFVSYKKDVSIPIISKFLRREYLRLKKRGLGRSYWHRCYHQVIHYLILLFKDTQRSFALLIDEENPLGIDFAKRPISSKHRQKMQAVREQYLKDYFELHQQKQRVVTAVSLIGSSAVVGSVMLAALILPFIFTAQAATFGWVQTSWSGGYTNATATHPGNRSDWNQYSTSTNITMINGGASFQIATSSDWVMDSGSLTTSSPDNLASGGGFANGVLATANLWGSQITLASSSYFGNVIGAYTASVNAVAFDDSRNYVWVGSTKLQIFNAATGAQVGSDISPSCAFVSALSYDSTRDIIWSLCYVTTNRKLQRFNAADGTSAGADITIGTATPRDVLYDSHNNAVWVVGDGNLLYKYDADSGSLLASTSTVAAGWRLAYDSTNDAIWVTIYGSDQVKKFSASDLTPLLTATVGDAPIDLAYDSTQNAVWVGNYSSSTLQRYDAITGASAGFIIAVSGPYALHYDAVENAVWAACQTDSTVRKFNAATGAEIAPSFAVGNTANPSYLAFQNSPRSIWVGNNAAGTVAQISAATQLAPIVQSSSSLAATSYGAAFDPVNNITWVSGGGTSGVLQRFNADTGASAGANISVGSTPRGVAYVSSTNEIWVVNTGATTVQVFDASTGAQSGDNISIGSGAPEWACYDSVNNAVWVTKSTAAGVIKYDVATRAATAVTTAANPTHIACDTVNNAVWVTIGAAAKLQKFNAATGEQVGDDITTGTLPKGAAYDSVQDAVWVVNRTASTLQRFSATTGAQIGTNISVGWGPLTLAGSRPLPYSVAYDSLSNAVWVLIGSDTNKVSNFLEKYDASSGRLIARVVTGARANDKSDIVFDNLHNTIWSVNTVSNSLHKITAGAFSLSGSFISDVIDLSQNVSFTTVAWLPLTQSSILGSNALKFQLATSSEAAPASWDFFGPDGTADTYYTFSGEAAASGLTGQYVKYKAYFTSVTPSSTPFLNSLTLNYTRYATTSELVSSKYDSGSDSNLISKVSWSATGTSTDRTVKIQIRAAATEDGLDAAAWCGYSDAGAECSGTDYFEAAHNNVAVASGQTLMSGSGHRWFQYRVILASDGLGTPVFEDINIVYLVNARPEFTVAATASQRAGDGLVIIDYSAIDSDAADEGAACPNCMIPSFEYSIDDGANWAPIVLGLPATSTATTTIATSTPSNYTVAWDAKNAGLDSTYATNVKIRITINDQEGGANTAVTTTAAFVLDVKDPAYVGTGIKVIGSTTPASLELNASDDTVGLQMCLSLTSDAAACSPYVDYSATTTFTISTPSAKVYAHFKDTFDNVTTLNASTPDMPTSMVIRDISDVVSDPNVFQEFIAWKVVTITPPPTFVKYHLWRSVAGGDYAEITTISSQATNYYLDQGLASGVTYAYKVTVEDSNGNVSKFSASVSDSADGLGGTNTTPPTISNVEVTATTTQTATIEWDTNELANSTVHYTADVAADPLVYDQIAVAVTMLDSAAGLGRHSVVLTGLSANTPYNFTVESENAMGNSATNNNTSAGYTFTTKSGPQISGVTVNSVSNSGATVIWNTTEESDTNVVYSTSSANLTTYQSTGSADYVYLASISDSVLSHSKPLTGLNLGTTYYYYVKSGVATDNNAGSFYNFTTAVDTVAPVITVVTSTIVTDIQALISWTTGELSDSLVEYGVVSGVYDGTASDANLSTSHQIVLSGLATSTKYYYKVTSVDASGNSASSTESDFTTLETLSEESAVLIREQLARDEATDDGTCPTCPTCGGGGGSSIDRTKPVISAVSTAGSALGLAVSWVTDKLSSSFVEYGLTTAYGKTVGLLDSVTQHAVILDNLNSNASYHYRVSSIDANGNIGQSADGVFDTSLLAQSELSDVLSSSNRDQSFIAAVDQALKLVSQMASQVSIGALESVLNSQYNAVRQLSGYVPAPLLGGEPKVTVTANNAIVTWSSDKPANSLVAIVPENRYDKTKGDEAYSQVIGNADEAVLNHLVALNDLEPETVYHYQVRSMSGIGSLSKSADFIFKTKSKELEISNYTVEKLSDQTVVFRWLSNVETDSAVKYTPYRQGVLAVDESASVKSKAVTTLHEVTVDGFESGLIYQVELSGKDLSGKIVSKQIPDFSTGQDDLPPSIYQVQTESALSQAKDSNVQTIISWLTNEPAIGRVYYKKGADNSDANWEETPLDSSYTRKHIVVVTKFEPGSVYQFKIESADSGGNLAASKIYTLLAPKQKESVFTVIMNNFEDIFGWTKQIGQ